jgi:MFS transporter, DHA2 family, multidrug resistance protein
MGLALIGTFARVRGQVASNLIGLHVQIGDGQVVERLKLYARAAAPAADPAPALGRSLGLLGSVVRSMATTQGVIDSFIGVGAISVGALLLLVIQRGAPEGPSSPMRLRRRDALGAAL